MPRCFMAKKAGGRHSPYPSPPPPPPPPPNPPSNPPPPLPRDRSPSPMDHRSAWTPRSPTAGETAPSPPPSHAHDDDPHLHLHHHHHHHPLNLHVTHPGHPTPVPPHYYTSAPLDLGRATGLHDAPYQVYAPPPPPAQEEPHHHALLHMSHLPRPKVEASEEERIVEVHIPEVARPDPQRPHHHHHYQHNCHRRVLSEPPQMVIDPASVHFDRICYGSVIFSLTAVAINQCFSVKDYRMLFPITSYVFGLTLHS
ncbi:leucine-rich repeat extensin-like protein 3 [Penaeus chinensis]|uniref:leucine-rich repeat extensin-like protein 3 n=1 Tax=Penaeus chinensis TaxID=139456 RepID=UPI001FB6F207|nr:leucine-rich repeat extensin-like protein 3 [Penaeus chinensis]